MTYERLKALYDAEANVHYKGKLCEIIGINDNKQTAQAVSYTHLTLPTILLV